MLSAFFTGCAHLRLNPQYTGPAPLPPELAARYAPAHAPVEVRQQLLDEHARHRRSLVQFPLAVDDFKPTEPVVEFEWYESKEPGRRPAILLNPILGGDYPLERGICQFFADHGFHVALVHRKTLKVSQDKPVDHLELLLRQGILRIRQIVDWMQAQERVDTQRMGSFGISMGGIATIITAAVEPRLRCHVAALPGGSIPDILMTTSDSLLTKPRAKYLNSHQLDLKTLDRLLRDSIQTDPLRLAPYVDARSVFMIIALMDHTIGRQNSLRLWRAIGKPEVIFLPTGHYTSYLYLPVIKRTALRFFQAHLGMGRRLRDAVATQPTAPL